MFAAPSRSRVDVTCEKAEASKERQARSLDKKRTMEFTVERSEVASGRWPAQLLVDRLAAALGVKGRSGSTRTRDTVKAEILGVWPVERQTVAVAAVKEAGANNDVAGDDVAGDDMACNE